LGGMRSFTESWQSYDCQWYKGEMKKVIFLILITCILSLTACSTVATSVPTPTLSPEIVQNVIEADEVQVVIQGFTFEPSEIIIHAGTKVTWVSLDIARHNVSGRNGEFDSKLLLYGETYSFTFDKTGEYSYFNKNFPDAKGKVIVIP
jgi:plastocyanin